MYPCMLIIQILAGQQLACVAQLEYGAHELVQESGYFNPI